jgi:plasmid stabilization system protein ParE
MTSTPKNHKDNTPEQSEQVIDRLLDEVRSLRTQLYEVRHAVNNAGPDFDRMSVVGGIKKISKDRKEGEHEIRKLNKELDRLIKSS